MALTLNYCPHRGQQIIHDARDKRIPGRAHRISRGEQRIESEIERCLFENAFAFNDEGAIGGVNSIGGSHRVRSEDHPLIEHTPKTASCRSMF